MSHYWEVIAPVSIAALAAVAFLAARLSRPHPGTRAEHLTPDVREATVPVAWTAGLPPWAAPEADRYAGMGWNSGSSGHSLPPETTLRRELHLVDAYDPADWPAADLAALHDAPTVLDDLPREDGAGDESEGYGLTAPPAPPWITVPRLGTPIRREPDPPTRLLRTTGELLNAELLAEVCAFMARQDTEVAVWLAGARERWAAV